MNDFEEIANELNNDSNRFGKVIFVLFMVIAVGIIIFLGVKELKKKNEKKEVEENETVLQSTDFDCHDKCTYNFDIDGKKNTLVYEKTIDKDFNDVYKLVLNGTEIMNETLECGGPLKFYVLDDTFIYHYRSNCNRTIDTLIAYDESGNKLFEYGTIDPEYPDLKLQNSSVTIGDHKVIVRASSLLNNTSLILDNKEYDICDTDTLEKNKIYPSTIVEAVYEIRYQGNLKYKDPVRTKIYSLQKYKELHGIEQICANR